MNQKDVRYWCLGHIELNRGGIYSEKFISLLEMRKNVLRTIGFLANEMANLLRNQYRVGGDNRSRPVLDLQDTTFYDVDLSRVDFSKTNISGTSFLATKLTGAVITP